MGDVVTFVGKGAEVPEEVSAHAAGTARCCACHYEWMCVAPVGCIDMECPECGVHKGHYKFPMVPPPDALVWQCGCTNDTYYLVKKPSGYEFFCTGCGVSQDF